jgi:iron complex transport system substrate-binding protein
MVAGAALGAEIVKARRLASRLAASAVVLLALAAAPALTQTASAAQAGARPAPQRIVSLLPSLTETVCELQACSRLVGTDRHSNWPHSVRALPKLGGLEDTQIERIVALKPDLVLLAVSSRAGERLRALGLNVLALEPQGWADTREAIVRLADTLGTPTRGAELNARLEARLAAATARVPAAFDSRSVYFEVASTPHAAGQASFIGELLGRLGLTNVVPTALGPFPQLNPEFVLRAQPALVMASRAALAGMHERPGWQGLTALQQRQTCAFEPAVWDTLVRPGPRLAEGAEAIAACLQALGPGTRP